MSSKDYLQTLAAGQRNFVGVIHRSAQQTSDRTRVLTRRYVSLDNAVIRLTEFMGRDPDQVCNEKFWSLTQPVARFIEINGHKVPAPESSPPARGTEYYVPALSYIDPLVLYVWDDDQTDHRCLERGLVHLTKGAASAHAKALLSFKVDPVKK